MGELNKSTMSYIHREGTQYQCADCPFWIQGDNTQGPIDQPPPISNACTLHQPQDTLLAIDTCNYFVKGSPDTLGFVPLRMLNKDESGWARNDVGYSCKRCEYWNEADWDCAKVNKDSVGDDPGMIHPDACCNGWSPDSVRALIPTSGFSKWSATEEQQAV